MDKKVEEIIKKNSQAVNTDFKKILKERKIKDEQSNKIKVRYDAVVKLESSSFPTCPIIDVTDDHYFHTIDGRNLMFSPNQVSPYIFLPSLLFKAFFHKSGDKTYFITLDVSNNLQYSVFTNGYPSDERYMISRNVVKVFQQSDKIFYVHKKNDTQYVNCVFDDKGVLKGKQCGISINSTHDLNVFYTNSTLFVNIDSQFQKEDGKMLSVHGDQICGIGHNFIVSELKEKEVKLVLLNEKHSLMDQLKIPTVGRDINLYPFGNIAGVRVNEMIYVVEVISGKLRIREEIVLGVSPLAMCVSLDGNVMRICEIVFDVSEGEKGDISSPLPGCDDFINERTPVEEMPHEMSNEGYIEDNNDDQVEKCDGNELHELLKDVENTWTKNQLPVCDGVMEDVNPKDNGDGGASFEPYTPDRSQSGEFKMCNGKIDVLLRMQESIEERINKMEKVQDERFKRLSETLSRLNENQNKSQGSELNRMMENLKVIESRMGDCNELRVLDSVKKIVIGTLVPIVEVFMDEMRIQVINEIRLIHDTHHLKDVKNAVNGLHNSFNKQNEVKILISQGLVEEAAELALRGSEVILEAFVSSSEVSCLEHLSSSVLVALLERVLVMAKDDFKYSYQNFVYMVMMCVEPNDLNYDEIQVLELLMSHMNNIEGFVDEIQGLSVVLEFQKLKLSKIKSKSKRGVK